MAKDLYKGLLLRPHDNVALTELLDNVNLRYKARGFESKCVAC
jgi:hypothetical protein